MGKGNCRSLGSPGFPVESCGFGQLHVVLFRENHIRVAGKSGDVGNPGLLGMTKERATVHGKWLLDRCVFDRQWRAQPAKKTFRPRCLGKRNSAAKAVERQSNYGTAEAVPLRQHALSH
jgi:hypothetical protein